jgi:lysophospholipase L1-like esterase
VAKCCTSSTGTVTLGYDGAITSTVASGAGTGILSSPPTVTYLGTIAGSGAYLQVSSLAISDYVVCNVSNPNLCGDWARSTKATSAAFGDSITSSNGWLTGSDVTAVWPSITANLVGSPVASLGRGSWRTLDALPGWSSAQGHRYQRVAVLVGINDINWGVGAVGAAVAFDNLQQLYAKIIANGAIPVPMTVLPTSLLTGQKEIERQNLNIAILAWCTRTGYRCADSATYMDDGTYGGTPGRLHTIWASADGLHPNQDGETALGTFMSTYFR